MDARDALKNGVLTRFEKVVVPVREDKAIYCDEIAP